MRFLEELHADLEGLQATLRAAGVPEAEVPRRAQALLAPREEALEALSAIHRPLWVRWRERAPVRGGRWLGAGLVLLGLAGVAAVLWQAAAWRDLPLFLVPLVGIAVAAAAGVAAKVVRIWILGDSEAERVKSGSEDLLVAAAAAAVATGLGMVFELYGTAVRITAEPALEFTLVVEWVRRCVVLGAVGIGVALTCGLAWLFFTRQAAGLARRERSLLGPDLRVETGAASAMTGATSGTTFGPGRTL